MTSSHQGLPCDAPWENSVSPLSVAPVEEGTARGLVEQAVEETAASVDDRDVETEEARVAARRSRRQAVPTEAERQEHNKTHLPYRSWCRICVAARCPDRHHLRGPAVGGGQDERLPERAEVAFDYCYLRNKAGGKQQRSLLPRTTGQGCWRPT